MRVRYSAFYWGYCATTSTTVSQILKTPQIDKTRDAIDCGAGEKDKVYYDKDLDTIQGCEIARVRYQEGTVLASSAAAKDVNTSRLR